MKKNEIGMLIVIICVCLVAVFTLTLDAPVDTVAPTQTSATAATAATTTQPPVTTTLPIAPGVTTTVPQGEVTTEAVSEESAMPTTTQEIIDQYTLLVDKYKKEKPSYKRKEYQELPEDNRNFSSAINFILNIAAGYMVSPEDAEEKVVAAGSEDILYDMPIHGAEKGCALTDYGAVDWAKCEDLGDGTYKLSFSLKEEYNAEPTPADTLIAPSAHGAVMQPMAYSDIKAEVDKVAGSIPGITVNKFNLIYRDCEFSCIYNPETDEVKSITHHIVIDIEADVSLFGAAIVGSARLVNDMLIYDITW